jgi:hypothetical protein
MFFTQKLQLVIKIDNIKLVGALKLQLKAILSMRKIAIEHYKAPKDLFKRKLNKRHLIKQ